jgi:hypothetical protein
MAFENGYEAEQRVSLDLRPDPLAKVSGEDWTCGCLTVRSETTVRAVCARCGNRFVLIASGEKPTPPQELLLACWKQLAEAERQRLIQRVLKPRRRRQRGGTPPPAYFNVTAS